MLDIIEGESLKDLEHSIMLLKPTKRDKCIVQYFRFFTLNTCQISGNDKRPIDSLFSVRRLALLLTQNTTWTLREAKNCGFVSRMQIVRE